MNKKAENKIKSFQIVKIVDLEPISVFAGNVPSFSFRIEVLRDLNSNRSFHARVFRNETFRIQPTFPMNSGRPSQRASDEHLFVEDVVEAWEKIKGKSAEEALERVIKIIRRKFAV